MRLENPAYHLLIFATNWYRRFKSFEDILLNHTSEKLHLIPTVSKEMIALKFLKKFRDGQSKCVTKSINRKNKIQKL